jgi:hypothetical protein
MSAEMGVRGSDSYGDGRLGVGGGMIWGWYGRVWVWYDIIGRFPIWAWLSGGDLAGAGRWARVGIRGAAFTSWIWRPGWGLYGDL